MIKDAINELKTEDSKFWKFIGDKALVARPFADLGETHYIRFSLWVTDWTLETTNDTESVRACSNDSPPPPK